MMAAYQELAPQIGVAGACRALALNRAGVYRERGASGAPVQPLAIRPPPPLSLTSLERQQLLDLLDSERFAEMAPAGIFATLLDEGRYHGSIRTMYRLLAVHHQLRERRRQRVHPLYAKPELLAVQPNQVWSWDITKRTPRRCRSPPRWGSNA
jgi:putative transposase